MKGTGNRFGGAGHRWWRRPFMRLGTCAIMLGSLITLGGVSSSNASPCAPWPSCFGSPHQVTGAAPRNHAPAYQETYGHAGAAPVPPQEVNQRSYELLLAQVPLDEAATRIEQAAAKLGAANDGFFNTEVHPASHLLIVRWHGAVPAAITRLVNRIDGKISIRVVPAAYSFAVLEHAITRAMRLDPAVSGGYPLTSGSGLQLYVRASGMHAAASLIRARLGIPVVTAASPRVNLLASCIPDPSNTLGPGSRCYDLPPGFWGGDVIISPYVDCTGGFGVHDSAGNEFMMTAAHCAETPNGFENGVHFINGNNTASVGYITDVPGPHDGALIPTSTGNRYYDGRGIYAGGSYFTKQVVGQLWTSVNDNLCESGAFGGVICQMVVKATGATIPGDRWNDVALAASLTGNLPIQGDSGGPWFSLAGSGTVNAQGITHANVLYPDGSVFAVFTPISVLSGDMGVSVNT